MYVHKIKKKIKEVTKIEIKQSLIASNRYYLKCPYAMQATYITVHETDNYAPAVNEISYMKSNDNEVSFHVAVDDKEAIQGIPFNRNAWAAGDGVNGPGNRRSIHIEICYNKSGDSRYEQAKKNAMSVVAQLMKQFNIQIENVVQHNRWSGKNCPSRMRNERKWNDFIAGVKYELNPPTSSVAGKRVESLVNNLNFYDSPRWSNPSGLFNRGEGFTIIDRVKVDGYEQYKVKNSKEAIYYVTASPRYVVVK